MNCFEIELKHSMMCKGPISLLGPMTLSSGICFSSVGKRVELKLGQTSSSIGNLCKNFPVVINQFKEIRVMKAGVIYNPNFFEFIESNVSTGSCLVRVNTRISFPYYNKLPYKCGWEILEGCVDVVAKGYGTSQGIHWFDDLVIMHSNSKIKVIWGDKLTQKFLNSYGTLLAS